MVKDNRRHLQHLHPLSLWSRPARVVDVGDHCDVERHRADDARPEGRQTSAHDKAGQQYPSFAVRAKRGSLFFALLCFLAACGGGDIGGDESDSQAASQNGSNTTPRDIVPAHTPSAGEMLEYGRPILLADTRVFFTDDPDHNARAVLDEMSADEKREAELVIYLPPVPGLYRGILFGDGRDNRYTPHQLAGLFQFVSVQAAWNWQNRVTPDDPDYLPALLQAIADYTGRPEIANIPWALIPRQGAGKDIAAYFATRPERTIAIGFGFGDNKRAVEIASHGFPVTFAHEGRDRFDEISSAVNQYAWEPGSLIAGAVEHGWSKHWSNSKPSLGLMLISQAIKLRLAPGQVDDDGTTQLIDLTPEAGWLGAFDPIEAGDREFAPFDSFQGDRSRCASLPNEEFALAWAGYMNPEPLVSITGPVGAPGLYEPYLGKQGALLPLGPTTISWTLTPDIKGQNNAKLVDPDPAQQARVTRVELWQGGVLLGGTDGGEGSLTLDLEPGVHLLVPVAILDDGSRDLGWPVGLAVEGDMYRGLLAE